MNANIPVLPFAGGALARVLLALVILVTYWLKQFARARAHRREARVLAGLDRHMLADIGITRADLRDAFSAPFWEDPTVLLKERSGERRRYAQHALRTVAVENGFKRPATDRPARHAIYDQIAKRPGPLLGRMIRDTRSSPLASGSKRPPAPPAGAFFWCVRTRSALD